MQWWLWWGRGGARGGGTSHQEFPLLLPVAALSVGGHVGLRHQADELPLLLGGLQSVPRRLLQLLLPPALPVLLDQLPLGQPLAVVQNHWSRAQRRRAGMMRADRKRRRIRGGRGEWLSWLQISTQPKAYTHSAFTTSKCFIITDELWDLLVCLWNE